MFQKASNNYKCLVVKTKYSLYLSIYPKNFYSSFTYPNSCSNEIIYYNSFFSDLENHKTPYPHIIDLYPVGLLEPLFLKAYFQFIRT